MTLWSRRSSTGEGSLQGINTSPWGCLSFLTTWWLASESKHSQRQEVEAAGFFRLWPECHFCYILFIKQPWSSGSRSQDRDLTCQWKDHQQIWGPPWDLSTGPAHPNLFLGVCRASAPQQPAPLCPQIRELGSLCGMIASAPSPSDRWFCTVRKLGHGVLPLKRNNHRIWTSDKVTLRERNNITLASYLGIENTRSLGEYRILPCIMCTFLPKFLMEK